MIVEVYYIKKRNLYLTTDMCWEKYYSINKQKKLILCYFIYGEGRTKTSVFEKLKIEIPDTTDNLSDIFETNIKYGRDVCLKYLITNHSVYRKYAKLNEAISNKELIRRHRINQILEE